jgi:hypothetical protein
VIDAFTRESGDPDLDDETAWLPAADPYRRRRDHQRRRDERG